MNALGGLRWKLAAVLFVTAVCLALALGGVDLDVALEALAGFEVWMLVPMALCYLCAHALRALRLQTLLRGEGRAPAYARVFSINTVGFLAINVMPLRLGEAVRPYLLWEREGVPLGRALAAILLERLLDLLMLLVMLLGLGFVVDLPTGGLMVEGIDLVSAGQRAVGFAVLVGVVGGGAVVLAGEPALTLIRRLPMGVRVAQLAERFIEGLSALARRPVRLLGLLAVSVCIWALTLGGVMSVMAGFAGIPVSLSAAWVTWTATITGMTLIPTPGFFGAYELFCSRALWLFDVNVDIARAFAILLHLGQLGFTVLIGSVFLVVEGLSLRDLVRPADANESSLAAEGETARRPAMPADDVDRTPDDLLLQVGRGGEGLQRPGSDRPAAIGEGGDAEGLSIDRSGEPLARGEE